MTDTGLDPALRLRAAGLRVTGPRIVTLRALAASPHAAADELAATVRERFGAVSTQAIYDVLRACTDAGIIRRIEPAGSSARYELRVGDNHHHLICRVCRVVEDVDCAAGRAPCLDPSDARGFTIDEAEVVYWGVCRSCAGAAPGRRPAAPKPSPKPTSTPAKD